MKLKLNKAAALACVTCVLLACAGLSAHAQQATPEQMMERLAAAKERLGLSDEQVAQIKPLMQERGRRFAEIRDKYAGDDSRSAKRKRMQEARTAQQDYENAVEPILTDAQAEEWREMQKEMRQEVKERSQESREATPSP